MLVVPADGAARVLVFLIVVICSDTGGYALGALIGKHPIGWLGRSEEISGLVLFLLSDHASFITGSYHLVDGGYTAP